MGMAETADLVARLTLKGNFNREAKTAVQNVQRLEKNVDTITRRTGVLSGFLNRNLSRAVDTFALRFVSGVTTGLEEMATLEDAATSVAGAIKQVGPAWKLTAEDIVAAANRIESETDAAFDDKAIVAASETLIRYGKVSEKNLVPAIEVMTDLAAKTGDVDSAATLLAKALADPEKAAGKLARQGIILTEAQQKQIKAMVKAGDTAGAQALLLEELEKTTRGAAKASAGPYRDALNKLGDAGEDLRRGFVTGLAPAILEVTDLLTSELAKPSTIQTLKDVGKGVGGALTGIIGIAKSLPWGTIGESLRIAGTGAKAILDAFLGLPPWVQTAVITGWGLNKVTGGLITDLASGLVKGVLGINAGTVIVKGPVAGGGAGLGGGGKSLLRGGLTVGLLAADAILIERLITEIRNFNTTVTTSQQGVDKLITESGVQNFDQTISTLTGTVANLDKMAPWDRIGAEIFGGGQITGIFESAADRITEARTKGELDRGEMVRALEALTAARQEGDTLKLPKTEAEIRALTEAIKRLPQADPKDRTTRPQPTKLTDSKALNQATVNAVKNAQSIASRENSAQKAELGNVKNAVQTQTQTQTAQAVAQQAATALQTIQMGLQAASAALRDAVQTQAIRTGASQQATATRGVSPPIVGALHSGFAGLRATIWAARPVIQSTNVVEKYTTIVRTGGTSDSRNSGPLV